MKFSHIFAINFFIVSLIGSIIGTGFYNYNNVNEILTERVYAHLETAAQLGTDYVEMFLREHKQDILTLSDDVVFRELLTTNKSSPDYKEKFERANKQLNSIVAINDEFNEIFILDSDGKIVATSHILKGVGNDFYKDAFFLKGKDGLYLKDAYYNEDLKEKLIGISAPILDDKTSEVKGVVVAEISLKELAEITTRRAGLGKTGEIYIVNREMKLITPSRFIENSIMVQKVETQNVIECYKHIEEHYNPEIEEVEEHEKLITSFLDYRGEKVFGTHHHIPEMNWCLLAEIDESEALKISRTRLMGIPLIIIIITTLIITLLGYLIGIFLDKKYRLRKE